MFKRLQNYLGRVKNNLNQIPIVINESVNVSKQPTEIIIALVYYHPATDSDTLG